MIHSSLSDLSTNITDLRFISNQNLNNSRKTGGSEKVCDVEPEFGPVGDLHRFFAFEIGFAALRIVFVAVMRFPVGFEFVPWNDMITGNIRRSLYIRPGILFRLVGIFP